MYDKQFKQMKTENKISMYNSGCKRCLFFGNITKNVFLH